VGRLAGLVGACGVAYVRVLLCVTLRVLINDPPLFPVSIAPPPPVSSNSPDCVTRGATACVSCIQGVEDVWCDGLRA
jgi:hypothetical protein